MARNFPPVHDESELLKTRPADNTFLRQTKFTALAFRHYPRGTDVCIASLPFAIKDGEEDGHDGNHGKYGAICIYL
ncbi:hypothetical protein HMPREF1250_0622 [Megasphaera vaginalis (ex Srinivasan et al. 2021)]|uniref:Uncharacterized protein n=1 Tax=Megasphaera vaginalis (ex Srinivasan et al. 2021) TaxID=1111454 RepID=U7UP14_9FIRM|nr:hypothetical protein HMPREF1250_0622 [Megasphaera vaginalis (ex Srinivasan et al. 2021)]